MTAMTTSLRTVLRVDAVACAAFGVAMTAGAPLADRFLGLGTAWAVPLGVYLLGCAAALVLIAGYPDLVRGQVGAIAVNNAVAAVALAALPFTGLVDFTAAGYVLMLASAVLVAGFAVIEAAGARALA